MMSDAAVVTCVLLVKEGIVSGEFVMYKIETGGDFGALGGSGEHAQS